MLVHAFCASEALLVFNEPHDSAGLLHGVLPFVVLLGDLGLSTACAYRWTITMQNPRE
jgi:hypothetical protein